MTSFPLAPKPACRLTNFSIELSQNLSNVTEKTVAILGDVLRLMQHTMHAQDSVNTLQQDNCCFFLTARFSESSPVYILSPPFRLRPEDPGQDFCSFIYHSSYHP